VKLYFGKKARRSVSSVVLRGGKLEGGSASSGVFTANHMHQNQDTISACFLAVQFLVCVDVIPPNFAEARRSGRAALQLVAIVCPPLAARAAAAGRSRAAA